MVGLMVPLGALPDVSYVTVSAADDDGGGGTVAGALLCVGGGDAGSMTA